MGTKLTENKFEEFRPSQDFSWVIVAVAENGDTFIMDTSQGFVDCDAFPNGRIAEDSAISWNVELEDNAVYKLTNFHNWVSRDWESGIPDDWGWEAGVAELLYKI